MTASEGSRPWKHLEELVEAGGGAEIERFLEELPAGEAARALSRLDEKGIAHLMTVLDPYDAASLLDELSDAQAVEVIEHLDASRAAVIVDELPSAERADLLGDLAPRGARAILEHMPAEDAADVRRLLQYADDVAGGLMVTECLAYPEGATVAEVIEDLRRHAERYRSYDVQYAYVTGREERLVGVLRLRDLLLAQGSQRLADLMIADPLHAPDDASLDALREFFDRHDLFGVPVVDADHRLLGVVHRAAVQEALADRSGNDYLKAQGIVREELRSMPLLLRSRRRLAWLTLNIVLNVIAASVIALHEQTLSAVIALAVFLPIISDMSGCSGNQAVAVSMRELALGLVRPREVAWVWVRELAVGAINGLVLGTLLGLAAWAWKGNVYLGLVVGTAMAVNTVVAVSIGGTVPLVLKRMGRDPALASGPILTTMTDLIGFLLVLSFATAMLPRLTGG